MTTAECRETTVERCFCRDCKHSDWRLQFCEAYLPPANYAGKAEPPLRCADHNEDGLCPNFAKASRWEHIKKILAVVPQDPEY